jgi:hypothetical protein
MATREPVSEELAATVRRALMDKFAGSARAVRTEIQDGGLFLFVEAELTAKVSATIAKELCRAGGAILDAQVPSREDEYSWILNLTKDGAIVRSESGGWTQLV